MSSSKNIYIYIYIIVVVYLKDLWQSVAAVCTSPHSIQELSDGS